MSTSIMKCRGELSIYNLPGSSSLGQHCVIYVYCPFNDLQLPMLCHRLYSLGNRLRETKKAVQSYQSDHRSGVFNNEASSSF